MLQVKTEPVEAPATATTADAEEGATRLARKGFMSRCSFVSFLFMCEVPSILEREIVYANTANTEHHHFSI